MGKKLSASRPGFWKRLFCRHSWRKSHVQEWNEKNNGWDNPLEQIAVCDLCHKSQVVYLASVLSGGARQIQQEGI